MADRLQEIREERRQWVVGGRLHLWHVTDFDELLAMVDELQRNLDEAIVALKGVVEYRGSEAVYMNRARNALRKIEQPKEAPCPEPTDDGLSADTPNIPGDSAETESMEAGMSLPGSADSSTPSAERKNSKPSETDATSPDSAETQHGSGGDEFSPCPSCGAAWDLAKCGECGLETQNKPGGSGGFFGPGIAKWAESVKKKIMKRHREHVEPPEPRPKPPGRAEPDSLRLGAFPAEMGQAIVDNCIRITSLRSLVDEMNRLDIGNRAEVSNHTGRLEALEEGKAAIKRRLAAVDIPEVPDGE